MPANEMRPSIKLVQRACEAAGARQAVVVWFDANGKYAVASYGTTKAECTAVKPLCNAIAEANGSCHPRWRRDESWFFGEFLLRR